MCIDHEIFFCRRENIFFAVYFFTRDAKKKVCVFSLTHGANKFIAFWHNFGIVLFVLEFDLIDDGFLSEIVEPRFQAFFVAVHETAGEFVDVWVVEEDVHGLALVNEGLSFCEHVDEFFLFDFERGFIHVFDVLWNIYILHAALVFDELIDGFLVPRVDFLERCDEVFVDDDKRARDGVSIVEVALLRFASFVRH